MNKREIKKDIQRRIETLEELVNYAKYKTKTRFLVKYYGWLGAIRELKDILKGIDL